MVLVWEEPTALIRAVGEGSGASRLESGHQHTLTPFCPVGYSCCLRLLRKPLRVFSMASCALEGGRGVPTWPHPLASLRLRKELQDPQWT